MRLTSIATLTQSEPRNKSDEQAIYIPKTSRLEPNHQI